MSVAINTVTIRVTTMMTGPRVSTVQGIMAVTIPAMLINTIMGMLLSHTRMDTLHTIILVTKNMDMTMGRGTITATTACGVLGSQVEFHANETT